MLNQQKSNLQKKGHLKIYFVITNQRDRIHNKNGDGHSYWEKKVCR